MTSRITRLTTIAVTEKSNNGVTNIDVTSRWEVSRNIDIFYFLRHKYITFPSPQVSDKDAGLWADIDELVIVDLLEPDFFPFFQDNGMNSF